MTSHKTCARCNASKPLDEFHSGKRYKLGRQSWCKDCVAAYKREYRARNADRIARQSHEYYEANKEKKLEYRHQYYQENKERENQLAQEWRESHKEQRAAISRAYREADKDAHRDKLQSWRKANPDKTRQQEYRRRANERAAPGKFTADDIHAILKSQHGRCVYCHANITGRYTVDHIIPLSRGGTNWPDNLQLLCASCNSSKNDRTHDEFMAGRK